MSLAADRPGPDATLSRVARGSVLNLAGSFVAMAAGLGVVVVVGRTHGAVGAGVFFTATALFSLVGNGAKLGADSGLTYLVSRCRATGRVAAVPRLVWSVLATVALLTAVLAVAGVVTAPWLALRLTDDSEAVGDLRLMLQVLAVALPTWTVSQAAFGATRGFATMRPSVFAGQFVRPLAQLTSVAVVSSRTDALWPLAVAWAGASGATMVPVLVWLHRRLARIAAAGDDLRGEFWAYTRPRAAADVVHAALERLDVVLVGSLAGSAAAGVYGAANRLVVAGQMIMQAGGQAMAPHLGATFARGDRAAARYLLVSTTVLMVLVLWPMFIVGAFGASAVLDLLGPGFEPASVVVVLAIGIVVVSGLGPGDVVVSMAGRSRASLANHVVALAVMVATAVLLVPTVGVVGAAWAWVASRVVLRALAVGQVRRWFGVHPFDRSSVGVMAITAAVYVPVGLGARLVLGSGPGSLVGHALVGAAVHGGVLWWGRRALRLDELAALAGWSRPAVSRRPAPPLGAAARRA